MKKPKNRCMKSLQLMLYHVKSLVDDPSYSITTVKDLLIENLLVDDPLDFSKAKDQNNENQCKEHILQDELTNLKSMIKIKPYEDSFLLICWFFSWIAPVKFSLSRFFVSTIRTLDLDLLDISLSESGCFVVVHTFLLHVMSFRITDGYTPSRYVSESLSFCDCVLRPW